MFSHFGIYETGLIRDVGGFHKGLEGSQNHDLILRCIERAGHDAVVHIPHVAALTQNVSAVTAACLVVKRSIYEEVGGFDEELAVAFNDVDFVSSCAEPDIKMYIPRMPRSYHHKSATRGSAITNRKP
jgi:GT2 family glycosyltransferase